MKKGYAEINDFEELRRTVERLETKLEQLGKTAERVQWKLDQIRLQGQSS